MKRIFEFFSRRHILATLFTIGIVMLGLNSLRTLKRDQFPEVDIGEVVITTTYPGASPEDVELNVTNKLEDELKNVTGIEQITSSSMENLSIIDVMIDPDVKDMDDVKTDIREAVGRVTDFPEEVTESPLVTEITTAIFPIIEVGITGADSYSELREIAKNFEKKLKDVQGVSSLEKYGYRAREVKVEVDPRAIERYQLPLREIIQAIRARNIRMTGGTFESFTSEKNVVTLAQFREPEEVGDVIVRTTFEGPSIKVKDLAVVRDDFKQEDIISRMEGRYAISFVVNKSENADIIRTAKAIKTLIREETGRGKYAGYIQPDEEREKNAGLLSTVTRFFRHYTRGKNIYRYGPVQIIYANDMSKYVRSGFGIVLNNGAIGLVLVVIMLTIFLNIRTAFWVAVGIPVSMLGVFFLMPFFGTFLDTISLASLILVIGIIVDDGIIISENIAFRRYLGDTPLDAAVNGVSEVFFPVLTTVLTTFLAFAPMFFMKGMLGKFIYVIPLTVSLALFISLFEAVFALPAHLKRGLEKAGRKALHKIVPKWFERLKGIYSKFAKGFLKGRYPIFVVFIGVFLLALWYMRTNMDFILFPTKGAERFTIYIECPRGTSLHATSEKVKEVEEIVSTLPYDELDTYITRVGVIGWVGRGENYAHILVGLTPFSERTRTADQIIEYIRGRTERLEGFEKITYEIDAGGPPVGKAISLRIVGHDDEMRRGLTDEVVTFLSGMEGVKDIDRNDKFGKDQIEIKLNYERLARLGLSVADVAQNVRIAYDGEVVTSFRDGDEDVDFRVQFAEKARKNTRYLQSLVVPNAQGRLINLRQVASLETGPGPSAYRHFEGQRTTTVEADVNTDVTTSLEVNAAVMAYFRDLEKRFPGMRISVGGEAEESRESITNIFTTFVIAFIGIYFLLILLFNSFTQPFLVLIAVPFGFVGVIVALVIHGEPLGFLALIGAVGLAGVVVNDSLVLVNHLNDLRKQFPDMPIRELVATGATNRLRAILLTTLTTVVGLLPLAYGIGGSDIYMAPMALALGYGLLFATPTTLILVPCLYMIFYDLGRVFRRENMRER
jgi:multidrug efflux pump subunit AcrB